MENNKRPTQAKMALEYMREHGSITSLEAIQELGIMSFPKRSEMVTNRYGKRVMVKRYSLVEEVV